MKGPRKPRSTAAKVLIAAIAAVVLFVGGCSALLGVAITAGMGGKFSSAGNQAVIDCTVAGAEALPSGGTGKGIPANYLPDLEKAAKVSGIPVPWLAAQIRAESNWDPTVTSPVGATGLAQFMPGTWAAYGSGSPTDPHAAIAAQGRYMGYLLGLAKQSGYPGSPLDLAFAGYNSGWGNVTLWAGIPPFSETQNYVAHIREYAKEYGASKDTLDYKPGPSQKDAACDAATTKPTGKNDYPWPNAPYWPIGADAPMPGAESPQGFYHRECVDFAMWRVNQQLGSTGPNNLKYLNSTFRGDGGVLGNAATWLQGWQVKGWPTGTTPKPGAIAFYAAFSPAIGGGEYGHVAVVKTVNKDGTFLEEGYNMLPNDHQYYTAIIPNTAPTKFLYIPQGAR